MSNKDNTISDEFETVNLQVTCLNMRHKLMYVDERHARRGMVDNSSDTRVFWCEDTQDHLGPDGEQVHPDVCLKIRNCYCNKE